LLQYRVDALFQVKGMAIVGYDDGYFHE
jgi:hypothetical protein